MIKGAKAPFFRGQNLLDEQRLIKKPLDFYFLLWYNKNTKRKEVRK